MNDVIAIPIMISYITVVILSIGKDRPVQTV